MQETNETARMTSKLLSILYSIPRPKMADVTATINISLKWNWPESICYYINTGEQRVQLHTDENYLLWNPNLKSILEKNFVENNLQYCGVCPRTSGSRKITGKPMIKLTNTKQKKIMLICSRVIPRLLDGANIICVWRGESKRWKAGWFFVPSCIYICRVKGYRQA